MCCADIGVVSKEVDPHMIYVHRYINDILRNYHIDNHVVCDNEMWSKSIDCMNFSEMFAFKIAICVDNDVLSCFNAPHLCRYALQAMSGSLESYNEKQITVITGDGRIIVVSCWRRLVLYPLVRFTRAGLAQGLRPNRQSDTQRRTRTRVQR
jgi:hypothetical protein